MVSRNSELSLFSCLDHYLSRQLCGMRLARLMFFILFTAGYTYLKFYFDIIENPFGA